MMRSDRGWDDHLILFHACLRIENVGETILVGLNMIFGRSAVGHSMKIDLDDYS